MSSFICPFCDHTFLMDETTSRTKILKFGSAEYDSDLSTDYSGGSSPESLQIRMSKCPNCHKITVSTLGMGTMYSGKKTNIYPLSEAKVMPEYVPKAVRDDYSEAYAILHLSPKASATLARRALQGMIRDFFGISKGRLVDEINDIKGKISTPAWKAIDAVRSIGNIGAHMEKDVNLIVDISDDEATKLLWLIEYLVKNWYVEKHDSEQFLQDIQNINKEKQEKRHNH